jgi:hypothetical protein
MWLDVGSNGSSQRLYSSLLHPLGGNPLGIQSSGWADSTPHDTNWHHQVIVMDGSSAKGYCDGVLVHSKSYTAYDLPGNIHFGGRSGYVWNGDIAIAKIYERELTEAEIKANFEATRGRFNV